MSPGDGGGDCTVGRMRKAAPLPRRGRPKEKPCPLCHPTAPDAPRTGRPLSGGASGPPPKHPRALHSLQPLSFPLETEALLQGPSFLAHQGGQSLLFKN